MNYSWTGTFNSNKTIREINTSQALNLTPEKKEKLITTYTKYIDEYTALHDKIGLSQ